MSEEDIKEKDLNEQKDAEEESLDAKIERESIEAEKKKEGEEEESEEEKPKRFNKPTLEEVEAYCAERNNGISAQDFINFYESKGWKIGKSPMKDWKAAVRTWEGKRKGTTKKPATQTPAADDFYMRLSR